MNTPTPETDAAEERVENLYNDLVCSKSAVRLAVDSEVCRKIERERDEAREALRRNIIDAFPVTEERVKWERLIQDRDSLKAHNEMLVEALQLILVAYEPDASLSAISRDRLAPAQKLIRQLPSDFLSEIALRNRKAKALDYLVSNNATVITTRVLQHTFRSPKDKSLLEAIEQATKEAK